MMKFLKICIVGFIISILGSCKSPSIKKIPLPDVETCTILNNDSICTDNRLPKGEREYYMEFSEMTGFQCTSAKSKKLLTDDIDVKRKELVKLRRRNKKKRK